MGELILGMKNDKKYHRRSIRLKGHNYSLLGEYFVTICAKNRRCLFGNIVNDKMVLNDVGMAAERCLRQIPKHYPDAIMDEYIIMPNPVHIIIMINNNIGANNYSPLQKEKRPHGTSRTIGAIIRGYKIGVTKWMRKNMHIHDVWQRNYYEHIIRNESELIKIQEYIVNNPKQWALDTENINARDIIGRLLQNPLRI